MPLFTESPPGWRSGSRPSLTTASSSWLIWTGMPSPRGRAAVRCASLEPIPDVAYISRQRSAEKEMSLIPVRMLEATYSACMHPTRALSPLQVEDACLICDLVNEYAYAINSKATISGLVHFQPQKYNCTSKCFDCPSSLDGQ